MKTIKILLISLFFISYSCYDDLEEHNNFGVIGVASDELTNKTLGKDIANSLYFVLKNNPKASNFIKDEALKKVDKDFDIIYQFIKNKKIGNKIFEDLFLDEFLKINKSFSSKEEASDYLEKELPLLQFYVGNIELWNDNNKLFIVNRFSISTDNSVYGYNHLGNYIKFESKEQDSNNPYIVISNNERISATKNNPSLKNKGKAPLEKSKYFTYRFKHQQYSNQPRTLNKGNAKNRSNSKYLMYDEARMSMRRIRQVEPWGGDPEFNIYFVFLRKENGVPKQIFKIHRYLGGSFYYRKWWGETFSRVVNYGNQSLTPINYLGDHVYIIVKEEDFGTIKVSFKATVSGSIKKIKASAEAKISFDVKTGYDVYEGIFSLSDLNGWRNLGGLNIHFKQEYL